MLSSLHGLIKGSYLEIEDDVLCLIDVLFFILERKAVTITPKRIVILNVKDRAEVDRLMRKISGLIEVAQGSQTR